MDYKFLIPTAISLGAIIWNLFQQKVLERIKRENQRLLTVHKTQFDKEFAVYSEVWNALIDFKLCNAALNGKILRVSKSEGVDMSKLKAESSELGEASDKLQIVLNRCEPFVPTKIHEKMNELWLLIFNEGIFGTIVSRDLGILIEDLSKGSSIQPDEMKKQFDLLTSSHKRIEASLSELSNLIRERIYLENVA